MTRRTGYRVSAVVTLLSLLYFCDRLLGRNWIETRSPDRRFVLTVWKYWHGPDESVRITISRTWPFALNAADHSDPIDRVPFAAEAYWAPDSSGVVVLICDNFAGHKLWMYSITDGREMTGDPGLMHGLLGRLQRRYGRSLGFLSSPDAYCGHSDMRAQFERELGKGATLPEP